MNREQLIAEQVRLVFGDRQPDSWEYQAALRLAHNLIEAACSQTVAPGRPDVVEVPAKTYGNMLAIWQTAVLLFGGLPDEVPDIEAMRIRMHALAAPPAVPTPLAHDEGCDCETCFYEARQSGKPDPKPGRERAVSTPRCPRADAVAKVIYERTFDVRWAEVQGIERALYLEVAEEVIRQFFQPDSQPSPHESVSQCPTCGHYTEVPPPTMQQRAVQANKGPCASCGDLTEWCCADCKIDKRFTVWICYKRECREKHEQAGQCSKSAQPSPEGERK